MQTKTNKRLLNVLTCCGLLFIVLAFGLSRRVDAQGLSLRGIGAVNESMAGAGTAAPLSAAGAIHWNPGSLADIRNNQAELGIGLVLPDSRIESTVGNITGSSSSESGVSPLPTMAVVMKTSNPRLTFGMGVYAIAGFKLNYNSSTTNPIHLPQGTLGPLPTFGRVNSEAEFFQIAPTISYALTDSLAIGVSPTITIGRLGIEPLVAAAPTAGGFPSGSATRLHFGGGGQIGMYYKPNQQFAAGLSVKTEQYFEDFRYRTADNVTGLPIETTAEFEYPLIVSLGTSYKFNERTLIATDVRYFDYGQAEGFGTEGLEPDGSIAGLGWDSVIAVAIGIQHRVTEHFTMRGGYVWNENPIDADAVFVNSAAPLNLQHVASLGVQMQLTDNMALSTTYLHAFDEATSGLFAGVPGTNVTIRTAAYALSTGITIDF